jgi:hypothetical protein
MASSKRGRLRFLSALAGVALGTGVMLIASRPADPSAQFFPAQRVVRNLDLPSGVDTVRVSTAKAPNQLPRGPIYRPNPSLTPGVVAVTNIKTVCAGPKNIHGLFLPGTLNTTVAAAVQQRVFAAYKVPALRMPLYGLDYLVPLQLGGADTPANIWPVPKTTRGLGFHDKEVLNIRVHILVCHGDMTLAQAQKQMATDWVSMWVQYGAPSTNAP